MKRLTPAQVRQFREQGYVAGIPIFTDAELAPLRAEFERVRALVPVNINFVNWWHKKNRTFYGACTDPRLLDCVEDLLGPSFFLWGSQFFVKDPGDELVVPWHQDAQYWPLAPHNHVTGFIALWDCDRENAGMEVIPGSHRGPLLRHRTEVGEKRVLAQEVEAGQFDPAAAVCLELKAGEISLHDDALIHGSGPNRSDRRRVGFTMRFSTPEVRCDLAVWPTFQAFQVRGEDPYGHNPRGVPPTEDGFPICMRP